MTRYTVVRPLRQTYPIWSNSVFNDPFFNEAFNWFFGETRNSRNGTSKASTGETYYSPRLNVVEDNDNYYVYLMLPGVNPEKLEVTSLDNKVTIKGESEIPAFGPQAAAQTEEGEGEKPAYRWLHRELPTGNVTFKREFELPLTLDADNVQATYDNGVLRLLLPKAPVAKPRKISVQAALASAQLTEGN
jgi:HSP20 family protein